MKNFKFSRLFAALMFVACLTLSACSNPAASSTSKAIEGNWVSTYGEKYVITGTDYDNYYGDSLYYSTTNLAFKDIDSSSGYIYGQFDDEKHLGSGAKVGQWYALYYTNLTATSVKLYQPWKTGGKSACNTLEEAISEYTVENGYFSGSSECSRQ